MNSASQYAYPQASQPLIAVAASSGEGLDLITNALCAAGSCRLEPALPLLSADAAGLCISGTAPFRSATQISGLVKQAMERRIPVLGIGSGMHALNVAVGGKLPEPVGGHSSLSPGQVLKQQTFLSPGAKASYMIGGSGWVSIPCDHELALRPGQLARGLLASAYTGDLVIEALELPGRHWVLGVQWRLDLPQTLPAGFDGVLMAFLERTAGSGQLAT